MSAPLLPIRPERAPAPRAPGATPAADPSGAPDQSAAIAVQEKAFDYEVAERSELVREQEALEDLLMAQLKNDDAIMKKWIAMI